jgi:hypothetical protein
VASGPKKETKHKLPPMTGIKGTNSLCLHWQGIAHCEHMKINQA